MTIFLGPAPDPDIRITLEKLGARNVSITANGFCGNSDTLSRVVRSGQSVTVVESCECDSLYIPTDNPRCHVHQINGGEEQAAVVGNTATLMFEGTGPDVNNLANDFDIVIEEIQPNGLIVVRATVVCSSASPAPSPFTVSCSVNTGKTL